MVPRSGAGAPSRLVVVGESLDRRPALATFVVLAAVYLATASWTLPYHIDALANAMTAWKLGTSGSVVLEEYTEVTGPDFFNVANQLVETGHGPVSKYPPGAALLAAPVYRLAPDRLQVDAVYYEPTADGRRQRTESMELPAVWPATLVAALITAAAMAVLSRSIKQVVGARWAWVGGIVVGLGTSLWSVAADALWQHGPAALGITLGLLGMSKGRYVTGSAGFALAVITRPQTAIIAAVVGIWAAVRDRSLMTLLKAGSLSGAGAVAYVLFNRWAFGQAVEYAAGGYWVGGTLQRSWWGTVASFFGALFSFGHGILIWSPFVALAVFGIWRIWKDVPWWVRAGAVAAVVYLVVQVRGNSFVGGEGFRWYRYQLESLVAASPLIVASLGRLWGSHPNWRRAIVVTVGFAVVAHAGAALL